MKISTRTRYGLRAMIEIAGSENDKGILQKDIAVRQSLSNKYLDQLIHSLKTAGLVRSVSGKKSGYVLTRKPEEITIYDIYRAFDPDMCMVECLSGSFSCERITHCDARGFWENMNFLIISYFRSVTLADVLNRKIGFEEVGFISRISDGR